MKILIYLLFKISNVINIKMHYIFLEVIGTGSFGDVYIAQNVKNNKYYAIKVEKKDGKRIKLEYHIYKYLRKQGFIHGIPKVYKLIETHEGNNLMIMQLLKKNIDDYFQECGKKFKLSTTLKLGIEITRLLEKLHNCLFIHRDIKPSNFMIGHDNELYIMDLGLSKKYITKTNKHIDLKFGKTFIGTARYASNNIHFGLEPSRRDDLESVGYMLIYLLKGKLPWQGLKKKNEKQISTIGNNKLIESNPAKLCVGLPDCFNDYLTYCKLLKFDETPNYKYLINLFVDTSVKLNVPIQYEFNS